MRRTYSLFVAEYIRGEKISAIENATVEELLSGKRVIVWVKTSKIN